MDSSAGPGAYDVVGRPPLDEARLRAELDGAPPWRELRVLRETTSTSDEVSRAAREGAPEGLVVVAELQTGGRGRLDREWTSPARAGLTFSVLLRPSVPVERWPVLPLLVGTSVASALRAAGVDAALKWPNDVLVDDRKLGGILAEASAGSVVVGVGLNVTTTPAELPGAHATSVWLETGHGPDRGALLVAALRALGRDYLAWQQAGGAAAAVLPAYRGLCSTVGRAVRVSRPAGEDLVGLAAAVDDDGRLVVTGPDGATTAVSAGDVTHVRPEPVSG